jgi:hypothetical protein
MDKFLRSVGSLAFLAACAASEAVGRMRSIDDVPDVL